MAPTYTTTAHGLRWLPGSNLASDIDAGFQALAEDVDTKLLTGGKTSIATAESRTNTAYGLLTTPDRVQSVVVPTDGIVVVRYAALLQESVAGAGRAAIFIGSNQLVVANDNAGGPSGQAARTNSGTPAQYTWIVSDPAGLVALTPSGSQSVGTGTGQAFAVTGASAMEAAGGVENFATSVSTHGGACEIFDVTAGTYDISVQFKSSSGSVTVKNRKLWVRVISF